MAVTQVDFGVALILGIAPALGFLWWSIRRFDIPFTQYRLFDDRKLFGSFAVGMIFGVLISYLRLLIGAVDLTSSVLVFLGILLTEELFKVVYSNRRGYRQRFDTTFYGLALGVGSSATAVVATVVWTALPQLYQPIGFAVLVLYSLNLAAVNADTGALIGFGASRGDLWRSFEKAVAIRYAHGGLLIVFLAAGPFVPPVLVFATLATALVFVFVVYHYVYTTLLPGTLPEELQREMRRERRRARGVKE
jgi:hypothetical protein